MDVEDGLLVAASQAVVGSNELLLHLGSGAL
jgi:hypothetical protein